MSFLTSENFDKILAYCLIKEKQTSFGYIELWKNLFQNLSTDDVIIMLEEMEKLDPEVFKFDRILSIIRVTPRTKLFFDKGGYSKLESNKEENEKSSRNRNFLELNKLRLEIRSLESANKKQVYVNLLAAASFIISVLLMLREFDII